MTCVYQYRDSTFWTYQVAGVALDLVLSEAGLFAAQANKNAHESFCARDVTNNPGSISDHAHSNVVA